MIESAFFFYDRRFAMRKEFQQFLFEKHVFVGEEAQDGKAAFSTVFALANLFGIKITEGRALAEPAMIALAAEMLGTEVPEPFYRGFPESVRRLTPAQLLFDQLLEYAVTYGADDFSGEGHSVFEEKLERTAFREDHRVLDFVIVPEAKAETLLAESVELLLQSTRPLRKDHLAMVQAFVEEYSPAVTHCANKDTAIALLLRTEDASWLRFLHLSDVIAVVDAINYTRYNSTNLRKLNLKNRDRKFISGMIDWFFENGGPSVSSCFEKKALWCGLLHHIHYQAKNDAAQQFVNSMRGRENHSALSVFECAMAGGEIERAVAVLRNGKGSGALLRNLNYILSRCRTKAEADYVLSQIETENRIILLQLLYEYGSTPAAARRSFRFEKYSMLHVHKETDEEMARRRTVLPRITREYAARGVLAKLRETVKGQLGKVYFDEQLAGLAVPLQEGTSLGGVGSLPRGSRMPLPRGKIIRAFTWWEKVNDIDLSVLGICKDGTVREFSWRTMASSQSSAITFSGDEVRGYYGGSEFFDINLQRFFSLYPDVRYLVFCDNVFSGIPFNKCSCRAGYMLRDADSSGKIYEPKTVETAYRIDCDSTFAYLFAFDMQTMEFVWLNLARQGRARIAGTEDTAFLLRYLESTKVLSLRGLIEMMAQQMTDDPAGADLIISDRKWELPEGTPVLHSYDLEKMITLINGKLDNITPEETYHVSTF